MEIIRLEKLIFAQVVKKFPDIYRTQSFITEEFCLLA
jgi:hypothetical protein